MAYQTFWVVGLTFLLWFGLVKTYSASKLSAFTFITPLFGVAAGYLIMHDPLTPAFGAAAVLVIAGITANNWVTHKWYVSVNGSAGTGTVAVYRGVQGSLLGYELSSLSSDSTLTVGTLPYFDQELVSKGIPAKDEADAQRIIAELTGHALECQTIVPAPSGCPGSPT